MPERARTVNAENRVIFNKKGIMMEHHIVVEKMCKCARRQNMPQIKTLDDKENAMRVARAWAQQLNESFCGQHEFDVTEVDENFVISVGEGSY